MPPVIWSRRALNDLDRLKAFLSAESPDAAARAAALLFDNLLLLERFPALGRPVTALPPGFREHILRFGKGAFLLRYRATPDRILLLAVRHSREADR